MPPRSDFASRFWIVPSRSCHSSISAITGCGVSGSNSVLLASGEAGLVARVLDRRDLHAEADAEVRDLVLARVLRRQDLAFDAALAEAARHQDRVEACRGCATFVGVEVFGVDVLDLDPRVVVDAGVAQRLVERLVRVRQVDVLAAPSRS